MAVIAVAGYAMTPDPPQGTLAADSRRMAGKVRRSIWRQEAGRALLLAVPRHAPATMSGCLLGLLLAAPLAADTPPAAPAEQPLPTPAEQLEEVIVQTTEPRFVSPTNRDRIGRIWAPVLIDGKGPYRLVLDTGANRSARSEEHT